jgi:hypothetical protein
MFDLNGIQTVMDKLKDDKQPGDLEYIKSGKKHMRYIYYFNDKVAFSFGLTRGSKAKSMKFPYVPRQMGLQNKEYKALHDCPWDKSDYNNFLIENEIV